MKELPRPNLDIDEVISTMEFIANEEAQGIDCTALREYLKPIIVRPNNDKGKGEVSGK